VDRGGKLALSHRRDVDIEAKIDAIVDDFRQRANSRRDRRL
jgi:hypothetical protein